MRETRLSLIAFGRRCFHLFKDALVNPSDPEVLLVGGLLQQSGQVTWAPLYRVAAGVVEARVLLAAHPDNRRTWLRFRGGAWSGANLFALKGGQVMPALRLTW